MPASSLDDRARAWCQRLVPGLQAALTSDSLTDPGYGSGLAGIGLALAAAQAAALVRFPPAVLPSVHERLIDAVADEDLPAGLFQGMAGVVWSLEQMARMQPALPALDVSDAHEYLGSLVEHYPDSAEYELTLGLLGLGVALQDAGTHAPTALVLSWLARNAEQDADGMYWRTRMIPPSELGPTFFTRGEINLGLAHGNLGVIAWLAHLVQAREPSPLGYHAASILGAAVRWIVHATAPDESGQRFGPTLRQKDRATGLGWCYGDLSAACVLGLAGRALGDDALQHTALGLALRSTEKGMAPAAPEPSLCHGLASSVYMGCRAARLFGSVELHRRSAQALLALVEHLDERGPPEAPGLLMGAAGVLCALGTWLDAPLPDWHRPLLV